MLFKLPSAIVKEIGYASCSECLFALHDIQSIDYFFAINAIEKRFEFNRESAFFLNSESVSQMFHVLLAISYFLRQGHSCLNISALSTNTLWSDLELTPQLTPECLNGSDEAPSKLGYRFLSKDKLQVIIQEFLDILPTRRDIELDGVNLYTARYANYEGIVAQFFREQQRCTITLLDPKLTLLQKCADELWPSLFPGSFESSHQESPQQGIDWQQVSVANGLIAQTSIISGGAGTGKTYTVARLLLSWLYTQKHSESNSARLLLAAPTGKAAQRLNESILGEFTQLMATNSQDQVATLIAELTPMIQAKTIHRLLGLGMHGIQPRYNEKKKLDCDFLVIDEASMIDLAMMAKLLRALPKTAKLVLIGDANQLPSVESGGLLKDLVNQSAWQEHKRTGDFSCIYSSSHCQILKKLLPSFPLSAEGKDSTAAQVIEPEHAYQYDHVTFLQKSMRSQNEITDLAEAILQGNVKAFTTLISAFKTTDEMADKDHQNVALNLPLFNTELDTPISWYAQSYTQMGTIKPQLVEKIAQAYEDVFKCDNVNQAMQQLQKYRLLCGTKRGRLGTEFLNSQIEQQLRKRFAHIELGQIYRGMPIMVVQNDYRLKLFNGDIGLIWTNQDGHLVAYFVDPENNSDAVSFSVTSLPSFELVYAMTIHKTQGSEFDRVDILLPNMITGSTTVHSAQHLSRELLYTGVTRAKKRVGLIASLGVLRDCIEHTSTRFSGLKNKLSK